MTRVKKYQKSLKQVIKESVKFASEQDRLFYLSQVMPCTIVHEMVKRINNQPNLKLKNKLIKSLTQQNYPNESLS